MIDCRDSETITSTLLKNQNAKLNRSKDFVLIIIVLNMVVLILTFIQEVVTFQDLEDYEIITISVVVYILGVLLKNRGRERVGGAFFYLMIMMNLSIFKLMLYFTCSDSKLKEREYSIFSFSLF